MYKDVYCILLVISKNWKNLKCPYRKADRSWFAHTVEFYKAVKQMIDTQRVDEQGTYKAWHRRQRRKLHQHASSHHPAEPLNGDGYRHPDNQAGGIGWDEDGAC